MTKEAGNHRHGFAAGMAVAGLVLGSVIGFATGHRKVPEDRLATLPVEERRELLKHAVWGDLPEATRLLLRDFDVNAAPDGDEITLLYHAVDADAPRSADVLLAAGADPYQEAGSLGTAVDHINSEEMWEVFGKHARPTPETEGIPQPVLDRFLRQSLESPVLVSFNGGPPPESILRMLRERNPEIEFVVDDLTFPAGGQTLVLILERVSPDRIRFEEASRKKDRGMSGGGVRGTFVKRHGFWVEEDQVSWDE